MLDTRRRRGWVLAVVVVLAGAVVWTVGMRRSADRQYDTFAARAHAAFDGTDIDAVRRRAAAAQPGDTAEFLAYFGQPGDLTDIELFPTPVAHYELPDAWGLGQSATVTWTDEGFTVAQG